MKTGHDLERGENGGSAEAEPEFTGSLLDPSGHGWQRYSDLGGLFTLYVRGNETRAELSLELRELANRIRRNRSGENEDYECEDFERMMFHAAIFAQAHREGSDCQSPGFVSLREDIAQNAIGAFGALALEIFTAPTREKGDAAVGRLAALATRAGRGMLAIKFPQRAKSSRREIPKELLMIEAARGLCETLRRLPTKREVCGLLTAIGIGFSPKSRNAETLWERLFERSGLICLPN